MPIGFATVHDLDRVAGVSLSKARQIRDFMRAQPQAKLDDVDKLTGIGPKTLVLMREHFY